MKLGFIGLGKMGGNMVERLLLDNHEVVVFDKNNETLKAVENKGAVAVESFKELAMSLQCPRIVWVMVPAGKITQSVIEGISFFLEKGDIIIDGGNSNYHDTINRANFLQEKGIYILDAGTSGGIWGLKKGYCLMIGGEKSAFQIAEPVFDTLAPDNGYAYMGPNGSGHFVKMVHNGIEYALLQAYGEGFEIMKAKKEFNLDLLKVARLWNRGSVIRSWLLELAELAFNKDPKLDSIKGYVEDSGEGRWTVFEAIDESIPAPIITLSLLQRFSSRQSESFSAKVIAALRNEFGGHAVKKTS